MSRRATDYAFLAVEKTPELKPSAVIVLLVLANMHNQETGRCDPSVKTIAKRSALSERAVKDGLRQLESLKLLVTVHRQIRTGKGKRNLNNRYKFPTAKFASSVGQDLPTKQEYTRTSSFDDLATLLDEESLSHEVRYIEDFGDE